MVAKKGHLPSSLSKVESERSTKDFSGFRDRLIGKSNALFHEPHSGYSRFGLLPAVAYGTFKPAQILPRAKDVRWLVPSAGAAATLLFSITNLPSRTEDLFFMRNTG